jgi:hypothetical protein
MKFILSIALIFLISCSEDSVEVTNSLSGGDVANMVAVANQMLFSDFKRIN